MSPLFYIVVGIIGIGLAYIEYLRYQRTKSLVEASDTLKKQADANAEQLKSVTTTEAKSEEDYNAKKDAYNRKYHPTDRD